MVKVYITPIKCWAFAKAHKDEIRFKEVIVAEETVWGDEVTMRCTDVFSEHFMFTIYRNGEVDITYDFDNEDECQLRALDAIYDGLYPDGYCTPPDKKTEQTSDKETEEDKEQRTADFIYEREDALCRAMQDLLEVVFEDRIEKIEQKYDDAIITDVLDAFLTFLTVAYKAVIYYPRVNELDDGVSEYVEYPYLYLLSDEDAADDDKDSDKEEPVIEGASEK